MNRVHTTPVRVLLIIPGALNRLCSDSLLYEIGSFDADANTNTTNFCNNIRCGSSVCGRVARASTCPTRFSRENHAAKSHIIQFWPAQFYFTFQPWQPHLFALETMWQTCCPLARHLIPSPSHPVAKIPARRPILIRASCKAGTACPRLRHIRWDFSNWITVSKWWVKIRFSIQAGHRLIPNTRSRSRFTHRWMKPEENAFSHLALMTNLNILNLEFIYSNVNVKHFRRAGSSFSVSHVWYRP